MEIDPKDIVQETEETIPLKDSDFPTNSTGNNGDIKFSPAKPSSMKVGYEMRKVPVPQHRLTPLKAHWVEIYKPIVEHMKLQIRMNTKTRNVEIRTCEETEDINALDKASEFVRAFVLGFDVNDALALLRLDDLYIDSFSIDDVKTLHGDNLSRAIGRIAGKDGKTKFAIENATRTRLVVADKHIHILGSFNNIKVARDAVVDLILGSPPSKIYAKLRTISARLKERF